MKKHKGYWIEVQIPQRKLILARGEDTLKVFPIAVGQPEFPSPTGERSIDQIVWNPWWRPPRTSEWAAKEKPVAPRRPDNPLGEIKIPLGSAYLIHGTRAIQSIGEWASHGCIRMLFEDIFYLTQALMTAYSEISAIDTLDQANRNRDKEFYTKLNRQVPVVLTYDLVTIHEGYVTISPDIYHREKDPIELIRVEVQSHLKKGETASVKKIKNVLRMFKGQTIHIPIENLASGTSF